MTHTLDSIMALADRMYSAPAGTLKDMIEGELRLAISEVLAERESWKEKTASATNDAEHNYERCRELEAECERLRKGGCARDQGLTQYCAEAAGFAKDAERLDYLDLQWVDGMHLEACAVAFNEKLSRIATLNL